MAARFGVILTVVLASIGLSQAVVHAGRLSERLPLKPEPEAASRLIVKYRPSVSACAHCLLAHQVPFATVTGSDSLDRLHDRLGIRSARSLYFEDHRSGDRSAAYFAEMAGVRARFPGRSARAGQNAAMPDLSNVFVLDLPRGVDPRAAARLYAADPSVEYAQPDYELKATLTTNDPFLATSGTWGQSYPDLWGIHITEAPLAWDSANGQGTVVAVVDTGVDRTHSDLAANMWVNPSEIAGNGVDDDGNGFVDDVRGWDFVQDDNDPMDLHGHGTHVAGTIAAVGNNGTGVVGMAWGAKVMAVRGLNQNGSGYTSNLAEAILYAAENGADVVNNSWGGFSFNLATGSPSALRDAVDAAVALGVVIVASSGNNGHNGDWFEPAGYPNSISVGASDHTDARASFSNYGNSLSVVAPGVDVLSLRGSVSGGVDPYGDVVASNYLRLNGTSMAAPHASGLSALLLSAQPALTPAEVRWHLELNADQPGYPGYEGELRNPYFGYGRINASRVFDVPPVTTRMSGRADVHVYSGTTMPDAAWAEFLFTTEDPVPWTLSSPAWLTPSESSGDSPAQISFAADGAGLAVGDYAGSVVLDAPGAVDGGGGFDASLHTHADPRIGGIVTLSDDYVSSSVAPGRVPVAADGIGVLAAWQKRNVFPRQLLTARLDGAGNVDGPHAVYTDNAIVYEMALAFDGRGYLLAWVSEEDVSSFYRDRYRTTLRVMRLDPSGQVLEAPAILFDKTSGGDLFLDDLSVGFDGDEYLVLWSRLSFSSSRMKTYVQRVGPDGSRRGKPVKVFPHRATRVGRARDIEPGLACGRGSCLMTWGHRTGRTSPARFFLDDVYGVRIVRGAIVESSPIHMMTDINLGLGYPSAAAAGTDYLVVGKRVVECEGALCGIDLMGARMSGAGALLDASAFQINPVSPLAGVGGGRVSSDGDGYLIWLVGAGSRPGTQIFGVRVDRDGQTLDTETPGALLLPDSLGKVPESYGTSMAPTMVDSPTSAILTWVDTLNFQPGSGSVSWTSPISAQRVLAHPPPPGFETIEIGAIGPRTVSERETLSFQLSAPSLDPASTVFSGANLPPGAVVDPAGIFRWTPAGDERGFYNGVHFEASDGVQSVSEDVDFTAAEGSLAVAGTVTDGGGAPVAGIALKLTGPSGRRSVGTDNTGRFAFEDLVPGTYRVRLDVPSRKQYVASPPVTTVTVGGSDPAEIHITVALK